jgi:PPOX class probable F420-dependent enzyme
MLNVRAAGGRESRVALVRVAGGTALALGAAAFVAADRAAVLRRETAATPDGSFGEHPFAPLRGGRFVRLATFRKSGEEVATPVWFVLHDGRLHVTTPPGSGKMKRIRNDPRVTLTPSDFRGRPKGGPTVEGIARDVGDEPAAGVEAALLRKYWFGMRMLRLFGRDVEAFGEGKVGKVTLEVRPAGG